MTFEETLSQVRELLQSKQRVSYRALKRQFALDDDYVEDLKAELIDAERVAADENGKVLVWIGDRINEEKNKQGRSEDERMERLPVQTVRTCFLLLGCCACQSTGFNTSPLFCA